MICVSLECLSEPEIFHYRQLQLFIFFSISDKNREINRALMGIKHSMPSSSHTWETLVGRALRGFGIHSTKAKAPGISAGPDGARPVNESLWARWSVGPMPARKLLL